MKTLIFAHNALRSRYVAEQHGFRNSEYEYIGSEQSLRGRNTGKQPRIIDETFYRRRDHEEILECLAIADLRPNSGAAREDKP